MLKCHHHLLGKADIISFIRNVFPVEPGGHGKLIVVYSQSVVAIQITVEAKQEVFRRRTMADFCSSGDF